MFAAMKFVFGALPYLIFAVLIAAGIVKAAQPEGSSWLLILSILVFSFLMGKCCLPAKH
jgi:hypothetical protein